VLARLEQIASRRIVLLRRPVTGKVLADRVARMVVEA